MANKVVRLPVLNGLGQTLRKDNWWAGPLVTFIVLASFVVYATFRAFEGRFYAVGPYLSPLASPYFETRIRRGVAALPGAFGYLYLPALGIVAAASVMLAPLGARTAQRITVVVPKRRSKKYAY